ncbi:MAG: hypothetical protein DRI69_07445 [Bacteroidetes bacterium]|nr:MAG: hypothetical protein DRI69_07445 [Bacteroidota bacterium]
MVGAVWVGSIELWCDAIIAIMFCGIAVRAIASLLRSEWTDPDVVAVDCTLRHAIAVVGEHHCANEIATRIEVLGADPVITNVSEVVKCGGGQGRCSRNIA